MTQKKGYSNVSDMVQATSSPDFAKAFEEQLEERQLVQKLQLMRAHAGLSQSDVAERLQCTQSKISKLESGKDSELSVGDLLRYAGATGHELQFVFLGEETKLIDEVKYHFFETKQLMEKLVTLADVDETVAKGVAGFFGEACSNFITMLVDKVKALPPQARKHVPLVKLVSEIGEKKQNARPEKRQAKQSTRTNGHNEDKVIA